MLRPNSGNATISNTSQLNLQALQANQTPHQKINKRTNPSQLPAWRSGVEDRRLAWTS